jgi:hypothetical protein
MKKFLFLVFVISVVSAACSRNTVGSKEPVIPKRDATITGISSRQLVSQLNSSITGDANYISQGKLIYETKCTRCHETRKVDQYTEQRWDGILDVMAVRARLNAAETQQVAAFIKANAKK